jgi:hypothetical protein
MAKIRRVDFYPDDMLGGVSGKLTPAQLGVYWMVCTLIYAKGGPIDNDHKWLANCLGGCNPRTVTAALDQLRAMGKIEVNGDRIEVERCMNELRRTGERILKNSEASVKGVEKRRENKGLPQPNGDDSRNPNSHQPTPAATSSDIITEIPKPKLPNSIEDDFVEWYGRYPVKVDKGRALKMYKAARKEVDAKALLDGLERYLDHLAVSKTDRKYIKHPSSWLTAKAWENDYGTKPPDSPFPPQTRTSMRVYGATREDLEPQSEEERQKGLALFQQLRERQENERRAAADATATQ